MRSDQPGTDKDVYYCHQQQQQQQGDDVMQLLMVQLAEFLIR